MSKSGKDRLLLFMVMMVGILLNVSFTYLFRKLNIPLYFDAVGTITVAFLAGGLMATIVAIVSSLICISFIPLSVYFTIINILTAFICDYFYKSRKHKTKLGMLELILSLTFINAILSTFIQIFLTDNVHQGRTSEMAHYIGIQYAITPLASFFLVNLTLSFFDRFLSLIVVRILLAIVPTRNIRKIRDIGWKQNRHAFKDMETTSVGTIDSRLQRRLSIMLLVAALTMVLIMMVLTIGIIKAYIGDNVSDEYFNDFVKEYIVRIGLIFSCYLVLILSYGIWISRYYLIYPINSMAVYANSFTEGVNNMLVMEEKVKKLKELDVHTDDEIENLYHALCKMAEDSVELMDGIRHQTKAIDQMQNGLIITMADLVESRDSETGYHIQKTVDYVKVILDGLVKKGYYPSKLTPKYISDVTMSAPLHDIGKISVPDAVLNKPGKLTDEEFEIMKKHTTVGKEIMEKVINAVQGDSYLKEARNMAAYHHEWWNGNGYPEGLKGEVIPLSARIMAVADVFDALTSKRVYKDAMPFDKAMDIIKEEAGSHFDPKCVEVFVLASDDVREIMKKYKDD